MMLSGLEDGTVAVSYIVLAPAFIEDHVHDYAGGAAVVLNHAHQLPFKLLLLCKATSQ